MTTTANVSDCTVTLDILSQTNHFIFIDKRTFLADKGYDVKAVYNTVKELYHGECVIPLNKRNTKNPKSSQADIPFVKQVLLWRKMVNLMTITETGRNTAAHWNSLKTKAVCAITNAGIMARKIEDAPNILLFPMITDFPLTVTVFRLRKFTHCEQKSNVTMHVSSRQDRSVCEYMVLTPFKIWILLLILLCLLLLLLLSSLSLNAFIAALNLLSVLLNLIHFIFWDRLLSFETNVCFIVPL